MSRIKTYADRNFFIAVLLCILFIGNDSKNAIAQTRKQVFITLDVSGSMLGDKYILANYTAQLISIMVEAQDEVYLIINGTPRKISGSTGVNGLLLLEFNDVSSHWPGKGNMPTQIEDIRAFNMFFRDKPQLDQWLFVIGDGIWETKDFKDVTSNFEKIVARGNLRVCYLQTGESVNENNDFTQFLDQLKVVTIRKSDTNPGTIISSCNEFTSTILGLSSSSIDITRISDRCCQVKPRMPVTDFIILYQDQVTENSLPNLEKVTIGSKIAGFKHKGSPGTSRIKGNSVGVLSGSVWKTRLKSPVMPGNEVTFCFDRTIDLNKLKIFPIVKVQPASIIVSTEIGGIVDLGDHVKGICKDNDSAEITIDVAGFRNNQIPSSLLREIKVEAISNNKTYKARFTGDKFIINLPLSEDTTSYLVRSELPGYFSRTTTIYKIVRTKDCKEKPVPPQSTGIGVEDILLGSLSFNSKDRGGCKMVKIIDSTTQIVLDPNIFDIQIIPENKFLFKSYNFRYTKQKEIEICFELRGRCLDCFLPDTLIFNIITSPKPGLQPEGKQYRPGNYTLKIAVEKEPRLKRCKCALVLILAALLMLVYLYFLGRKKRFKRGSKIVQQYASFNLDPPANQTSLRKKGFSAWINRWFNPFVDEKRAITITRIVSKTIVFYATGSSNYVEFLKSAFDPLTMSYAEFDPDDTKKRIRFANADILTVHKNRANDEKVTVSYDKKHGITNDVPAFRVFISILKVILIAFLMLTSYFFIKTNF